jgi:hypothetical protein
MCQILFYGMRWKKFRPNKTSSKLTGDVAELTRHSCMRDDRWALRQAHTDTRGPAMRARLLLAPADVTRALTWPVLDWSPRVLHAAVLAPMTKQTSLYFGSRHVKHQYFFNNASRRHQIKGKKSLERTVVRHMHGGIFQKDWSWRTTSLTFREFVAVISVP